MHSHKRSSLVRTALVYAARRAASGSVGRARISSERGEPLKEKVICPRGKAIGDAQDQETSLFNNIIGNEDFQAVTP